METKYPRMVGIQQRALAVLRIVMGLGFLYAFSLKLGPEFVSGLAKTAQGLAANNPVGFFADFLRQGVAPSGQGFAYVLLLSELVVGAFLVLGLFTAPTALLGLVIALCYALAFAGQGVIGVALFVLTMAICLVLAFGFAGCTWGLDRKLIERTPHWFQGLVHYEYLEF